uniref:Cadherin domain-containing protein n=1 Tax=Mola mola TaxID=94237 RepID=A0A3Q4AGV7_MOLML
MEQRRCKQQRVRGYLVACVVAVLLWTVASAQIRYSISEEVNEGTVVGNTAKDLGLDKSTLEDRKYRIVSDSQAPLFHVNGKDGILYVSRRIDREAVWKPPKSGNMNILVNVLDINDNAPVFSNDDYSVTLNENTPAGTTVIQVNATDLDDGSNGNVVYSLSNGMDQNILNLFDINQSTGEVIVKGSIDYEDKDTYEIEIEASDKGFAPLTTEKSVTINIIDMNDNTPEIEVTSFSSSIPEDSRPGTTVAHISVNDLDSGLNGKVICSLVEDVPFTLSPSLKDKMYSLVTKSPLDREKTSQYDLTITAKDTGQPPLSSEMVLMEKLFVL